MSELPDPDDVTGMGKGIGDHPVLMFMFGAAAAFGGGGLGASGRVPQPRPRTKPMTGWQQVGFALYSYFPIFVVPPVIWFLTHSWVKTLAYSALVWLTVTVLVGSVGLLLGYRRAKAGHID
jgi:hypothetical protein